MLVGHHTGARARSIAELPGLRQRVLDNIRPTERGASVSGPVRSMSENLAYNTSDQPLDLQVLRRTAETGRGGNGCRRFGHLRLFRKAWGTSCLSS